MKPIPVNTPSFGKGEWRYLRQCLKTGWVSSEGPFVQQFEKQFSAYVGRQYGVAVSNGSAALDIAVQALGIGTGDEVIMPAFTIISPALSVVRAGAKPVLVDADADTWNMDVAQIREKINPKTKAILVVHIYGLPVNMRPVLDLVQEFNLYLIEDAAEAHGLHYEGRPCGSFGDISTFSFYPNKLVTTGEGGMVVTNSEELTARCRKLRNLAFEVDGRRFIHFEVGWNYRFTNLQAALGLAQLEKADRHLIKKKRIGKRYTRGLQKLAGFQQPLLKTPYAENGYWVYGLVADSQALADQTVKALAANGIGTRPFFWSMHEQPVFTQMGFFAGERFPVSERLARNGFYLPSGVGLTKPEQDTVIETLCSLNG